MLYLHKIVDTLPLKNFIFWPETVWYNNRWREKSLDSALFLVAVGPFTVGTAQAEFWTAGQLQETKDEGRTLPGIPSRHQVHSGQVPGSPSPPVIQVFALFFRVSIIVVNFPLISSSNKIKTVIFDSFYGFVLVFHLYYISKKNSHRISVSLINTSTTTTACYV